MQNTYRHTESEIKEEKAQKEVDIEIKISQRMIYRQRVGEGSAGNWRWNEQERQSGGGREQVMRGLMYHKTRRQTMTHTGRRPESLLCKDAIHDKTSKSCSERSARAFVG